jgi:hypothetical protein
MLIEHAPVNFSQSKRLQKQSSRLAVTEEVCQVMFVKQQLF